MTCTDCQTATITQGCWPQYNSPSCKYCAARLIQRLGKLRTPTTEQITARRRAVLTEAIAQGHNEQDVRELAKAKTMAVQPLQTKAKK
jgi:hypothetical protein